MSALDPRLQSLLATRDHHGGRVRSRAVAPGAAPAIPDRVGVLVKFTGPPDDLRHAGLEVEAIFGDEASAFRIATGTIALDAAEALAGVPHVIKVEMDRPVYGELDVSTVEIKAKPLRSGASPLTGQGVVIGVIDDGFDYRHHALRFSSGGSRVLFIWDQSQTVRARRPGDPFQEAAPPEFPTLGVEYSQAQIDQALRASDPLDVVRTTDDSRGHGTHVTGIAAGDGSQAGTKPDETCSGADTYIGVAPMADIIFVKNVFEAGVNAIGRSRNLANAVRYIFIRAAQLDNGTGRPCVINISQGDNLGPHDGTSLVEQAINLELNGRQGRAVVKSAGNEGAADHHAMSATPIPVGGSLSITFSVKAGDTNDRFLECWYNGTTSLDVTLAAPGVPPPVSAVVHPGDAPLVFITNPLALAANQVPATIASTELNLDNGDKQITVDFRSPVGVSIPNGTYTIRFTNTGDQPAVVHCWLDRGSDSPVFTSNFTRSHTISIPGTADTVITVASYAAETFTSLSGAITEPGELADSSSRGPRRTDAQKPDIAAPGVSITAARAGSHGGCCCDCCYTFYVDKSGTSMAAPHVAGVVALMFQRNRTLDWQAIKTAITTTARNPGGGVALPDRNWGAGKIDASAALGATPAPAGGVGGGRSARGPVTQTVRPGVMHDRSMLRRLQRFQQFVLQFPAGHHWAALVSRHFDEVLRLINTNRRVATIWHRNSGPALVRAALTLAEDPARASIPAGVGDVPLTEQLDRIFDNWRRLGSPRLAADIDRYRAEVLTLPGRSLQSILTDRSSAG